MATSLRGTVTLTRWRQGWILIGFALVSGRALALDEAAAFTCAAIGPDLERLACYDRLFRGAAPGQTTRPTVTSTPQAVDSTPAAATTTAQFGLSTQARLEQQGLDDPVQMQASVVVVHRSADDRQVVELDNGQVWRQTEADVRLKLKGGEAVIIRKAALGSYMLIAPTGSMRVKRSH